MKAALLKELTKGECQLLNARKFHNSAGYGTPPRAADEGRFCPKGIQPNKVAPAQLSSCSSASSTLEQEQNQFNDTEDLKTLEYNP